MLEEITGQISRLDPYKQFTQALPPAAPCESRTRTSLPAQKKKKRKTSYQMPALWVFYLKKAIQSCFLREGGQ